MLHQNVIKKIFLSLLILLTGLPMLPQEMQKLISPLVEEANHIVFNQTLDLSEKLDIVLADERLSGASTGVSIRSADTGALLYEHFGDLRLHPASNMKILTGVAALETLGADYQFKTDLLIDGNITNDTLEGNVYLKGHGDPTLLKRDLDQFATDLKAYGIQKINGKLIGDDSWYDDERLSQDLNWSDESNYTGSQVSALTLSANTDYQAGTVIVDVLPSTVGTAAQVIITPENDYVNIVNRTKTVAAQGDRRVSIERKHGTNTIIVEGTIPVNGTRSQSWVSVWEPTNYVLDVFKKSLEENDIQLMETSNIQTGIVPNDATVVATKQSIPLSELIIPFMKLSNNGHGETLTKEMGKVVYQEGSWDKGLQVMEQVVAELDVDMETVLLRDGSGMSHKNMIPANEMTNLLYHVQNENWYATFESSLPVAGEAERLVGGTLRYRMNEPEVKGKVKAKTGRIYGVATLSGYITTKSGEKLIFSILINNYLGNDATSIIDEIVTLLAEHEFNKE